MINKNNFLLHTLRVRVRVVYCILFLYESTVHNAEVREVRKYYFRTKVRKYIATFEGAGVQVHRRTLLYNVVPSYEGTVQYSTDMFFSKSYKNSYCERETTRTVAS